MVAVKCDRLEGAVNSVVSAMGTAYTESVKAGKVVGNAAREYALEPTVYGAIGYGLLVSTESMLRGTIQQCNIAGALSLAAPTALVGGAYALYKSATNNDVSMVNRIARGILGGAVVAHTVIASHFLYNHGCK